jgi:predicted RNase H-like HicB family nuclease
MNKEFTILIEAAPEGGFWAICPEVPGANGQGETLEDVKESLREAVRLILGDRFEDVKRGLSENVIVDTIAI